MYCNSLEPFIGYDGSIAIKAGVHFLVWTGTHAPPHTHNRTCMQNTAHRWLGSSCLVDRWSIWARRGTRSGMTPPTT